MRHDIRYIAAPQRILPVGHCIGSNQLVHVIGSGIDLLAALIMVESCHIVCFVMRYPPAFMARGCNEYNSFNLTQHVLRSTDQISGILFTTRIPQGPHGHQISFTIHLWAKMRSVGCLLTLSIYILLSEVKDLPMVTNKFD